MTHTEESGSSPDHTLEEVLNDTEVNTEVAEETQVAEVSDTTTDNGGKPKSMLDAVVEAAKKGVEEVPESPAGKTEEEVKEETKGDDADESDVTNPDETTDDSKLPFNKHPRWKQINTERRKFKEQAETYQRQLDEVKPELDSFRGLVTYMQTNQLTDQEVNEGLEIMAAMKHNPMAALKMLTPHLLSLQSFVGEVLPPDVKQLVDEGEMTEERAKEFARIRNQNELLARQQQQQVQRYQQQQEQQWFETNAQNMRSAVSAWMEQTRKSDPDFAAKTDLFETLAQAELAKQTPQNPEEAVQIAMRAYEKVNQTVSKFRPVQPKPKNPSSLQSMSGAAQKPKNIADVVRMAANSSR